MAKHRGGTENSVGSGKRGDKGIRKRKEGGAREKHAVERDRKTNKRPTSESRRGRKGVATVRKSDEGGGGRTGEKKGTPAVEEVRHRWKNAKRRSREAKCRRSASRGGERGGEGGWSAKYKGHADKRTNELIISYGGAAWRGGGGGG